MSVKMYCDWEDPNSRLFLPYERFNELSVEEQQYALRIVHRELEKLLNMKLTDDEFITLFLRIKIASHARIYETCNVFNYVFVDIARRNHDVEMLNRIRGKGGWRISKSARICHSFFKEPFAETNTNTTDANH